MRRFAILSLAIRPAGPVRDLSTVYWPVRGATHWSRSYWQYWIKPTISKALVLAMCAALLCTWLTADHAAAQAKYRFVNIADSSGPLRPFLGRETSINNHGDVAFGAFEDGSNIQGIFVGNGVSTRTIAHTSGPYSAFWGVGSSPDINDSGAVLFPAGLDGGGRGIFVSDGITTKSFPDVYLDWKPQINQSGQVAFWGRKNGVSGLYIWDGNDAELVAPWPAKGPGEISLIDDGSVSYINRYERRILRIEGDDVSTIIESGAMVDFGSYQAPLSSVYTHSRNSSGVTAFIGNVRSELGIYIVNGEVVTRVTDHISPVRPSGNRSVAINDAGVVAFLGGNGRRGIYTGGDPATNKVIGIGDSLFGSTLSYLQDYVDINNRGDIAFQYSLAKGVSGVAVARVVPEPAGPVLLVIGLAVGCLASRRRWAVA